MNTTANDLNDTNFRRLTRPLLVALLLLPVIASAHLKSVSGTWKSNWGPVTFRESKIKGSRKLALKGTWEQAYSMIGKITRGTFDPRTGKVEFSFYQPWDGEHGSCILYVQNAGEGLEGPWKHTSNSGTWTLTRK